MGQTKTRSRSAFMAAPGDAAPSAAALMPLFAPYCGGFGHGFELAIDRLLSGRFEGLRQLRSGDGHRYELRWSGGLAPLDETRCQLSFPALPQISYSFAVPAHRLLGWLASSGTAGVSEPDMDLPDGFWRWLILGDDSGA